MTEETITDGFVDELNIKDIPPQTYCTLLDKGGYHLLYGREIFSDDDSCGVFRYGTKERKFSPRNFMTCLNYLTANGFELISYHPSSRSVYLNESMALLRKK